MKAHLVGIKGVGMTALALILQQQGWQVTGSDVSQSFVTDQALAQAKIKTFTDFSPHHITPDLDLVIYSGAYRPDKHPQLLRARRLKLRLLTQQEALANIVQNKQLIAVAGVGGKTTTSAMLAHLFRTAGRDVGYFVGAGHISGRSQPGVWGQDKLFVAEADEYANSIGWDNTPKLLLLHPTYILLPNLQYDHPDIYSSSQETLATFQKFIAQLPPHGKLYLNTDNQFLKQLITSLSAKPPLISVGFSSQADWQITDIKYQNEHTLVSISHQNKKFTLKLLVFGDFNARNALLASAFAYDQGLNWPTIASSLSSFRGVGRRQEFMGTKNGALFYDDYGHHPAEIKATLTAFKQRFPQRRLWLLFESHTYTRTLKLFDDFVAALSLADKISVMPIFSSAREKPGQFSISNQDLAQALQKLGKDAHPLSFDSAPGYVLRRLQPNDLILTMGAGIVYKLHSHFQLPINNTNN